MLFKTLDRSEETGTVLDSRRHGLAAPVSARRLRRKGGGNLDPFELLQGPTSVLNSTHPDDTSFVFVVAMFNFRRIQFMAVFGPRTRALSTTEIILGGRREGVATRLLDCAMRSGSRSLSVEALWSPAEAL